ncbi:NAD(P)/FAD-dependent oxidoreductase [Streptomyces aureocirculatus]|uniref:NAD(P)/FAD-dependent oxidoreductase n=1 Tax=Streptomyces aureocirculatus TaxID=67275 RepID=UPI0004C79A88|nr:NAD(P)/FAD-dependent oxidoreductase [Streptomyces aureocirculatus]
MYDVIVVGARCAGSPAAMLFARQGYRVLLLEKAQFPQDKLSSHYIHQPGVALLGKWGLLDDLRQAGCRPIDRISYQSPGVRLAGSSLPVDGHRITYAPRRFVLDPILAAGAVAAGAEFRDNCTVGGLLFEEGRVAGVRCRTPGGAETTERAHLVVGADGMRSLVARETKAEAVIEDPRMTCTYYSYWEGVPAHFEQYEGPGRWVGALPTNADLALVMTYFPQSEFHKVRSDVEPAYLEAVRTTAPELYERISAGRRVEQLYGTGHQENFFRKACGPGWVLIGDAVHHKDSIAARGITDAFVQADLLTGHIGDRLHDETALKRALNRYESDLDKHFYEFYRSTLKVAELKPTDERTAFLRSLVGDQTLIDRYFSTLSGACSLEDFYNDELLTALDRS